MEISFAELKEKEVVNVFDGRKFGRVVDVVFETEKGCVIGIVVPGERKLFHKNEDVFVPVSKLKKIGDDVILVAIGRDKMYHKDEKQRVNGGLFDQNLNTQNSYNFKDKNTENDVSFVRYKRLNNKKYK